MSTQERSPVLMLHGVFGHPGSLAPWTSRLEAAGYTCVTPTLPGRHPTNRELLSRTRIEDCMEVVLAARAALDRPPIIIGHSMGGLLSQKLAAATATRALVLLAPIPPGILWPQPRLLWHMLPHMPNILLGRPVFPGDRTLRTIPLYSLPAAEQDAVIAAMVPDSGQVFRAMSLGTPAVRVRRGAVRCPVLVVSGGADRNVAPSTLRRIARRYGATHHVYPGKPHWIIAESLADEIVPPVLDWLEDNAGG